jgi:hypothetical protein
MSVAMTNPVAATTASPPLTLERLVRPHNRRMMVLWALLAAAFAGWLYSVSETLWKLCNGPEPVTITQLLAMQPGTTAGRFFDVTASKKPDRLLQTTIETQRRRGSSTTTITNHFAFIEEGALLVETGKNQLDQRFFAWSQPFDPNNQYYERAVKQLAIWASNGSIRAVPVASVLLKPSAGPKSQFNFYSTIVGVATLALLYLLIRFRRKLRNYLKSAAINPLYGSVRAKEGIPVLVAEIDQQLAARKNTAKPKGWELFPTWLMVFKYAGPQLMSLQDVMWVAQFMKGKQHIVRVVARDGKTIDLDVNAETVMSALGAFHDRAPWAVIGPDASFEAQYNKSSGVFAAIKRQFAAKPVSKGELIRDCDTRRTAILAERALFNAAKRSPRPGRELKKTSTP